MLHPQPVFQPRWCDCESWLDALPGSTARGDSAGASQTPWDTGMAPELLGTGGRTSCQAAHCDQGSTKHKVGTSQRPLKVLCPQISPARWQRAGDKIWGWIPSWKRTAEVQSQGTVTRSPRSHPPAWRMAGAVVSITSPLPTALQPGRETMVQGTELQTPLGLPTSKRCGRANATSRAGCCQAPAGCWL